MELLHQVGKKLGRGLGFREKCLNPTVAGQFSKEVGTVRGKMAFFIGQDFVGPLAFRALRGGCGMWDKSSSSFQIAMGEQEKHKCICPRMPSQHS